MRQSLSGLAALLTLFSAAEAVFADRDPAAIIGSKDNRQLLADYAKAKKLKPADVAKRYSATGILLCDYSNYSASLVGKSNVLVFAAHSITKFDYEDNCTGLKSNDVIGDCTFQVMDIDGKPNPKMYKLDVKTVKSGPLCRQLANGDDWAVAKLKESVPNVVPYGIFKVDGIASRSDDYKGLQAHNVTVIAARSDNFGKKTDNSTICEGQIGFLEKKSDRSTKANKYSVALNCSSGHGGSGGPILDDPASASVPAFLGLISASSDSSADHKKFGPDNSTVGPILVGEFLDAVQSMQ